MNDEPETVICHAKPTLWWIIPLGLGEAVFLLVTPFALAKTVPSGQPFWGLLAISIPFAAFMLYGVGLYALQYTRGFIRADGDGLHWRETVKLRSGKWDEVTDFYDISPPHGTRKFVVETRTGNLEVDGTWTNTGALRDFIQRYATQSQSREWSVQSKGENWPRVFHYRGWENRWFMPIITACGILVWPFASGLAFFSIAAK